MKILSWEDIGKITDELTKKIKSDNFVPDYLIGITTGGLIPLYFLAKKLKVDNIFTISSEKNKKSIVKELLPGINLKDKKILFIDEITESGKSLKEARDFLVRKYSPRKIKTATLGINKDKCKFPPDFYVIIQQGEWIVFPWEKEEEWVKKNSEYV